MNTLTAKKSLDAFCRWSSPDKASTVQIYGGEPLTNMTTLRYSVEYVQRLINTGLLHRDSKVSIVSNGTQVDEDFTAFLVGHKDLVNISISLDGPQELHDKWRISRNGHSSYKRAFTGFKMLQKAGLSPSISCTLPPSNLPYVKEIVDWILEQKPNGISFNTMADIPGMRMNGNYAKDVADFLIQSFLAFRNQGLYEDRMMRKVKSFVLGKRFLKDCCGYGQQIVVAPNGDIGVCHGFTASRKYFTANVNSLGDFDPRKDPTFIEWSKRSPINMPQCQDCPALGICGGGCAYNAEQRHGSIWAIDDIFCPQALKILEWMIQDLYQQMVFTG